MPTPVLESRSSKAAGDTGDEYPAENPADQPGDPEDENDTDGEAVPNAVPSPDDAEVEGEQAEVLAALSHGPLDPAQQEGGQQDASVPAAIQGPDEGEGGGEQSQICTMEFDPQCTVDAVMGGSKSCAAAQNRHRKGGHYNSEWCQDAKLETTAVAKGSKGDEAAEEDVKKYSGESLEEGEEEKERRLEERAVSSARNTQTGVTEDRKKTESYSVPENDTEEDRRLEQASGRNNGAGLAKAGGRGGGDSVEKGGALGEDEDKAASAEIIQGLSSARENGNYAVEEEDKRGLNNEVEDSRSDGEGKPKVLGEAADEGPNKDEEQEGARQAPHSRVQGMRAGSASFQGRTDGRRGEGGFGDEGLNDDEDTIDADEEDEEEKERRLEERARLESLRRQRRLQEDEEDEEGEDEDEEQRPEMNSEAEAQRRGAAKDGETSWERRLAEISRRRAERAAVRAQAATPDPREQGVGSKDPLPADPPVSTLSPADDTSSGESAVAEAGNDAGTNGPLTPRSRLSMIASMIARTVEANAAIQAEAIRQASSREQMVGKAPKPVAPEAKTAVEKPQEVVGRDIVYEVPEVDEDLYFLDVSDYDRFIDEYLQHLDAAGQHEGL